jgi:hypothetical protein
MMWLVHQITVIGNAEEPAIAKVRLCRNGDVLVDLSINAFGGGMLWRAPTAATRWRRLWCWIRGRTEFNGRALVHTADQPLWLYSDCENVTWSVVAAPLTRGRLASVSGSGAGTTRLCFGADL